MADRVNDENLKKLLRGAGEEVRPSEDFHRRAYGRLLDEFRKVTPREVAVAADPRLVGILDRYAESRRKRNRVRRLVVRYWPVSVVAAGLILGLFLFPPGLDVTSGLTVELSRARSAILEASGPSLLAQAGPHLRQAAIRSQAMGAIPAERVMDIEFLRYVASHATGLDQRQDLLYMIDVVIAQHAGPRGKTSALPDWLAALAMPAAHAGTTTPNYVELLLDAKFKEAAELLAGDNRVTARFVRAWALKEAGEYVESRRLFEGLASELRSGSLIEPALPRAMAAYTFLWEGKVREGLENLASVATEESRLFFHLGYLRMRLDRDEDGAREAWASLPPGNLRSYAFGRLCPTGKTRPTVDTAYFTEWMFDERESCVALVLQGKDLDIWTRVRINGAEIRQVRTARDEIVIPLAAKPSERLHVEIVSPRGTLRRTLLCD